jgi:hypothetical protein
MQVDPKPRPNRPMPNAERQAILDTLNLDEAFPMSVEFTERHGLDSVDYRYLRSRLAQGRVSVTKQQVLDLRTNFYSA